MKTPRTSYHLGRLACAGTMLAIYAACSQSSAPSSANATAQQALGVATPPSIASSEECVPPLAGIIGWWPMDEASGTTVRDLIGTNPGVVVNGPAPADGQVGGALRFNGVDTYVGAPDSGLWAFGAGDFTVELWANWDVLFQGSIGHPGSIFVGNDEGPGEVNKWFFALGGGFLNVATNSPSTGPAFFPRAPFSPIPGTWYHLAVTKRGDTYVIYIDGEAVASAINANPIADANAPLTIGQAEELGAMNGRLDEVTIYDRALTRAELQSIYGAGSAGKCKPLQIVTKSLSSVQFGIPVSNRLLAAFGRPPLSWSLSAGSLPLGLQLDADGTLSGTPAQAGEFSVTVRVTDGTGAIAESDLRQLVLLAAPPSDVRIRKTGTLAIPGRTLDYFTLVENTGSATARNVQVADIMDPTIFSLQSTDPPAAVDASKSLVVWDIPELAPGEVEVLSYRARLDPRTPVGGILTSSPACLVADQKGLSGCLADLTLGGLGCATCGWECVAIAPACVPEPVAVLTCPLAIAECLGCVLGCGGDLVDVATCFEDKRDCDAHTQSVRGAIDPNEKLVTARRFIRSDELLVYPIHFENIGNAEARDVFVTDVLDADLDPVTLNLLTAEGGTFDPVTRTIKWNLLNRNLQPAETGNVLLSVRPHGGLASGTEIRNKALIQFEVFAPMETDEVVNIIDDAPPVCQINPLPAIAGKPDFAVSWSATDAVGELASYAVWVSTDGNPFVNWLRDTTETNTVFQGAASHHYAFLCVATDTAGNTEIQSAVAEAQTAVVASSPPDCHGARPSRATLWPPDQRFVPVGIDIHDADGDSVTVNVTSVTQDEPTRGRGECKHAPDAIIRPDDVLLRAERASQGNGRVYRIEFEADDRRGGRCSGSVLVNVPRDRRGASSFDDGQKYNSLDRPFGSRSQ